MPLVIVLSFFPNAQDYTALMPLYGSQIGLTEMLMTENLELQLFIFYTNKICMFNFWSRACNEAAVECNVPITEKNLKPGSYRGNFSLANNNQGTEIQSCYLLCFSIL